jgi:hypothetical protein
MLGVGFAYDFRFYDKDFEISAGIEPSLYNAKITINNFGYTSPMVTDRGDPFRVVATLMNYEETQRAILLTVPVMLRYHFGSKHKYYAGAGLKIGMPVYNRYRIEQGIIDAHIPAEYEIYDYNNAALDVGVGQYAARATDVAKNASIVGGTTFMLALEFGMQWQVAALTAVYVGAYADIGLNNIKKSSPTPYFMSYDPDLDGNQKVRIASAATTLRTDENGAAVGAMTKRIAPLSVGVKVSFYFGKDGKKPEMPQPLRDTIVQRDTIREVKKEIVEKVVEKVVERHDTIIIYDDNAPAPKTEPVAVVQPAVVDTTLPKSMVQEKYIPDDIDRDKKKKSKVRRSYQVQVLVSRRETDMTYFDVLRSRYPNFQLRSIAVGKTTHYTYGMFSNFEEARKWAYRYVALGYTDVFVVQVEGERIVKSFYNNKE